MLRTADGYRVSLPRFRIRRLQRRLSHRGRDRLGERAAARLLGVLVGRSLRIAADGSRYPLFHTRLGRRRLVVVTRTLAPRRVELLYIGRA
jgi:hypothetical protein